MPLHKHRTACCLRYMTKSNLIACWGPNSHRITTLWDWTSNPTGQGNKQFQPHFLMVKCIEALKKTCRFGEDRHHFNSTIDKLLAIVLPCHPGTFNATSLMSFLRHVVPLLERIDDPSPSSTPIGLSWDMGPLIHLLGVASHLLSLQCHPMTLMKDYLQ